jgi:predicted phosphodiesterase
VRYLILSDIHANWEALSAVLEHAAGSYDEILNCGDIVGYGPDPNRVVDWCRVSTSKIVRGNHDKACATLEHLEWFNPVAAQSARWTHLNLTPENLEYLSGLPTGPIKVEGMELSHGSPEDEDEYLVYPDEIGAAAAHLGQRVAFFGHTHVQGCYLIQRGMAKRLLMDSVDLEPDGTYMINPGSVGQPRDRNPRAAYALFDSGRRFVEMRRVEYAIPATQAKIIQAGLPDVLAQRLTLGR